MKSPDRSLTDEEVDQYTDLETELKNVQRDAEIRARFDEIARIGHLRGDHRLIGARARVAHQVANFARARLIQQFGRICIRHQ